jgi:hypothetical protein
MRGDRAMRPLFTALLLLTALPAAAQDAAMAPVVHEPLDAGTATPILGRQVLDQSGKAAGRIVDVLVDQDGQTRAAVVDVGGFLGLGQRRIAVAWRGLRFNPADGGITLLMPADQIGAAPEYKPAAAPVLLASPPPQP